MADAQQRAEFDMDLFTERSDEPDPQFESVAAALTSTRRVLEQVLELSESEQMIAGLTTCLWVQGRQAEGTNQIHALD